MMASVRTADVTDLESLLEDIRENFGSECLAINLPANGASQRRRGRQYQTKYTATTAAAIQAARVKLRTTPAVIQTRTSGHRTPPLRERSRNRT